MFQEMSSIFHLLINEPDNVLILLGICTTIAFFYLSIKLNESRSKSKPSRSEWTKVGKVAKLIIHPLKSCQGVEVEEGLFTRIGLKSNLEPCLCDRVFVVCSQENDTWVYQNSEKLPLMTAIKTKIYGNNVELFLHGSQVKFEIPEDNEENRRSCKLHSEKIGVLLDCGETVAHWLEENLEKSGLRLFYHHLEHTQREIMTPLQRRFELGPGTKGMLQAETTYMIMTQNSIDYLNTKLASATTWHSFRPTVFIDSDPRLGPFCEDMWELIRIGEGENQQVVLEYSYPCARCGQINIDQEVGKMSEKGEPLKTLSKIQHSHNPDQRIEKYMKNKAIMGANMGIHKDHCDQIIRVGDPVYAIIRV